MALSDVLNVGVEPYPGYRLVRWLGRGGWGEVWEAEQPKGPPVALKFLDCESPFAAAQEIRALQWIRQLRHPHLMRVDRIWAYAGRVVIAMELAEGSLLDLFDIYQSEYGNGIFPEHLCYYLAQAAAALDFLNTRQHQINGQRVAVRHCDVKPSNLLVLGNEVKLADFSLAAQATSCMWYHRRVGTLSYAAPEILRGWLSDRSDQYALAITYCELRAGRRPFPDPPTSAGKDYVRPAPDLSPFVPAEAAVLARALALVPQDRWRSCTEMMARLQFCLEEVKVPV
ncbi:MAG: protein kinase [Gemmataceae bacterium]|nr:protein kinase [Gemmataceae bacterium]